MILQLIVVPAELFRAGHIFLVMGLNLFRNRVELGYGFVDLPLHPIDSSVLGGEASVQSLVLGGEALVDGLKNNRGLLGEELLDIAGMFLRGRE